MDTIYSSIKIQLNYDQEASKATPPRAYIYRPVVCGGHFLKHAPSQKNTKKAGSIEASIAHYIDSKGVQSVKSIPNRAWSILEKIEKKFGISVCRQVEGFMASSVSNQIKQALIDMLAGTRSEKLLIGRIEAILWESRCLIERQWKGTESLEHPDQRIKALAHTVLKESSPDITLETALLNSGSGIFGGKVTGVNPMGYATLNAESYTELLAHEGIHFRDGHQDKIKKLIQENLGLVRSFGIKENSDLYHRYIYGPINDAYDVFVNEELSVSEARFTIPKKHLDCKETRPLFYLFLAILCGRYINQHSPADFTAPLMNKKGFLEVYGIEVAGEDTPETLSIRVLEKIKKILLAANKEARKLG